jgi:hypothetical protein
MKSGKIAVALAVVVVVAGIAYAFLHDTGAVADTGQESVADVVHVDDLADHPEKYQGEIVVKAVVARVNKAKGALSVIDFREFEECHEIACAKNYLPVKVESELPAPETVVTLTGQVVRTDKGLVFEAKRLEAK